MAAEELQCPSRGSGDAAGSRLTGVLGGAVAELANVISAGASIEIDRCGLESEEFAVLRLFCEQGEWNATQLARQLQIDASRISRLVTKLVDRRLLRRRRAATDRRVVHLKLTQQGRDLIDEMRECFEAFEAELLRGVSSKEIDSFLATVRTVVNNFADAEHVLPSSSPAAVRSAECRSTLLP
ncbi:MarR family winged helix-turn-helix transcriptional regulator [Candidatus Poriferisodalis sp.]|uniref:MarR family winged helix-turn-helix transcriptional regulator n=1 Tax=Candidatus Poriferisodalis sp. TaxID=3101277 RepID=UPI003C6FCDA4